jgi:O-antigen/teichoic acid export membrane protein
MAAQHSALLARQMRLTAVAAIAVVAMFAGVTAAVVAALLGAGYWALVIQRLVEPLTETVAIWMVCPWRPGLPRRNCGVRSMLFFGGSLTASNLVEYSSQNLDNLLIGWRWGAQPLGFYTKAYSLLLMPFRQMLGPMSSVMVPALSRLQNDPKRYETYYLTAVSLMVAIVLPTVTFLAVTADKVVPIILGPKWNDVVPIYQILAPAAFAGTLNGALRWVYVSLGNTQRMFQWGLFVSFVNISAFLLGLPWGPKGVAAAYSLCTVALAYPAIAYCFLRSPLRVGTFLSALWSPVVACTIAGAVTLAIGTAYRSNSSPIAVVLFLSVVFFLVYLFSLAGSRRGRAIIVQILQLTQHLRLTLEATPSTSLTKAT